VYISVPKADSGKVNVTETLVAPFVYTKQHVLLASVVAALTGFALKDT
jgi:hypothetical protein